MAHPLRQGFRSLVVFGEMGEEEGTDLVFVLVHELDDDGVVDDR